MRKNFALKLCAAAAMLLLPLPLLVVFDGAAFNNLDIIRYVIYYALSVIPVSVGYLIMKFRLSQTKPKMIFAANLLLGAAGTILSVLTIIGANTAKSATEGSFNVLFLCIGLIPAVMVWFVLGTKLNKRSFSDVFTFVWLGVYVVETFLCYILAAVLKADHEGLENAGKIIVYLLIIMALITVLLINQSNIETQIHQRRDINLIVPKGLKRYNAKLISIVGVVIIAALIFKDYIAAALSWFAKVTLQIIDAIIFNIRFQTAPGVQPDEEMPSGEAIISGESGHDFMLYIALVVIVILAIVFRKQIIAFFRKLGMKIFGKLSADKSSEQDLYDYTDSYERLDLKAEKIKRETKDNCLKRFKKEKDPTVKYRLGYKLYLMWLAPRSKGAVAGATVEQQSEQAQMHYHGEKDTNGIASRYTNIRYNDSEATESDAMQIQALIEELYK